MLYINLTLENGWTTSHLSIIKKILEEILRDFELIVY